MELEEIRKGTLIVEIQRIRNLPKRHITGLQEITRLLIGEHRQVIVHRIPCQFANNLAQIGCGYIQLIRIKLDLPLTAEVIMGQVKKDLQDIFLMTEVARYQMLVIRQLTDKEQADMH